MGPTVAIGSPLRDPQAPSIGFTHARMCVMSGVRLRRLSSAPFLWSCAIHVTRQQASEQSPFVLWALEVNSNIPLVIRSEAMYSSKSTIFSLYFFLEEVIPLLDMILSEFVILVVCHMTVGVPDKQLAANYSLMELEQ